MDEHSDLDLVIAVDDGVHEAVLSERMAIAHTLGPVLTAFSGEHVGAPHLVICFYGPPVLHVDLKFVALSAAGRRVDECRVLFDRDGRLARVLASVEPRYPQPDLQWIEDRIWGWVHYVGTKVARGELFEAIDGLGFIRARVLGPLVLADCGAQPNGVRRIESEAPERIGPLRATLPLHDAVSCRRALDATIALYRELRERRATPTLVRRTDAERESLAHLDSLGIPA